MIPGRNLQLAAGCLAFLTINASAAVRYVDVNSASPTPPYTNWATAALTIQDAVDAALAGDQILVTNGVYETGGKVVTPSLLTNRVAVTKAVTVQSVNGPVETIIKGYQVPGNILGSNAVRCVYLTNGAVLIGFTITNGATLTAGDATQTDGGGIWCESSTAVVSNCVVVNNAAYSRGGGVFLGTLNDCTMISNSVPVGSWWGYGGGVYGSTVNRSTLRGNFAWYGGGANTSSLVDCLLTENWAWDVGGGADYCTLNRCTLVGNISNGAGGAFGGLLNHCLIAGNSANWGGGTVSGTLNNCTIAGNTAGNIGGAYCGALNNCIIHDNTAQTDPNYLFDGEFFGQMNYCCTTPLPTEGTGNMTNAPLFVDLNGANYRLQSNSPCINAGNNAYVAVAADLDGNPRIAGGTVDMGAYEFELDPPPPTAPFANTSTASSVQTNQATLNGFATPNSLPTTAWFEWGTNSSYGHATSPQSVGNGVGSVHVSMTIAGLERSRTYRCRLVASNQLGVAVGAPQLFRTGGIVTGWGFNNWNQTEAPSGLNGITALAAGYYHSLALRTDGSVAVWGSPGYGVLNIPPDLGNVASIAAGLNHNSALLADGTLVSWGRNIDGECNTPFGLGNIVSVANGDRQTAVILANGQVRAWGGILPEEASVLPTYANAVAVAAGKSGPPYLVVLLHDRTVRASGYNFDGQATVPPGLSNVVAIAAGGSHNLALRGDGSVVGWGLDFAGQATPPLGLTNVIAIDAGAAHSLALRADGSVVMWGTFLDGGVDTTSSGLSNVSAITSGHSHNLALTPDQPPTAQSQVLSGVPNTDLLIQLSGSDPDNGLQKFRIQSLPGAGSLYQFSNGTRGELITANQTVVADSQGRIIFAPAVGGNGNPYDAFTFVADDGDLLSAPASVAVSIIAPLAAFSRSATAISLTSARLNGFVAPNGFATTAWFEWGTNSSYGHATAPVNAGSGLGVVHVAQPISGLAGGQVMHFRLVASNASQAVFGADQQFIPGGKVSAWGDNSSGQSQVPTNLGRVAAVAGGLSHSLALRRNATVAAWGNNAYGQTNVPAGLTTVASVAAGGFHSVAMLADGTVKAWGRNNLGQTNVPAGLSNVVGIAAGGSHNLALRADGSLAAWGDNSQGQRNVPASLTNVVGIAAGWYHNVALWADGTVTAWGGNSYGQANVPDGLTNVVWVGAGLYHSLALRSDGTLAAWGLNSSSQGSVPAALTNNVAAACGGLHNLVLRGDGTFTGWGYNSFNQASPPAALTNVVSFAAGGSHSLAITPNRLPVAFDQIVSGYPNADLLVTLNGSDADNDPLSYRISALPTAGAMYQFFGGARGPQIIAAGTTVSDGNGRVIFAPVGNQSGSPHATFGFTANDGSVDSVPATVMVNIILPSAPILDGAASGLATNGVFQLAFTGTSNAVYRVWASTNLVNWGVLGTASSPSPGQFLFLDATATNRPQRFYRATAP